MIYWAILICLNALILLNMKPRAKKSVSFDDGEKWTVYGSKGCPWCKKQVDYFEKSGKPYKFVDCDKGTCPEFVEGYPTLESSTGKRHNGFTKVFEEAGVEAGDDRVWKMYGSRSCSWTNKQIAYMRTNGKQFIFVDCDTEECEGINGYPTLVGSDGEVHNGYTKL